MLGDYQAVHQRRCFSGRVAQQVSLARRPSSRAGYQSMWLVFRQCCRSEGHSISHPSLHKIADFLFWLRRYRRLSVSSVMGYGSMLSALFKSVLPEISISLGASCFAVVISGRGTESGGSSSFLGSEYFFIFFTIFSAVDNFFITGFDPHDVIFASLTTAKRGGEIQALSRRVSFSSSAAGLSYVPELVAKTESAPPSLL